VPATNIFSCSGILDTSIQILVTGQMEYCSLDNEHAHYLTKAQRRDMKVP
jgi:hypothetical protein